MQKRLNFTFHVFIAASMLCVLASCGKTDFPPDCGAPLCQIETYVGNSEWEEGQVVNTFTYNSAGNPILRTRSDVATGNENETYRYDAKNRLTDQILHYEDGSYGAEFREWHRFKYQGNSDRPYMDSFYTNGFIGAHPIPYPFHPMMLIVIYFDYDHAGRLIGEKSFYEDNYAWYEKTYIYNSANNLAKQTYNLVNFGYKDTIYYRLYDDKVNFLRTNKVWQLLTRNYSENNVKTASNYNKYGLPLRFPADNTELVVPFLDADLSDITITYKCK
ncbi:hypothetical protein [Chitinophaga rhizophila]|uniref:YD repeat-containing protein n=1 Tax=Chitinophaga rhizophila TaxID=2866212 RepID=A0ABS7GBS1_9BACT|nr:hypothetical protein [Chitinophaga rhizophila]MBW8684254.1 hypothetical protein [Chitinophaga rhizophila]